MVLLIRPLNFSGSTVDNMSVASRMTMSNMAVEAGAKCALFTPDEKTARYCDIELNDYQKSLKGDADAVYVRTLTYRAEDFVPVMACPSQVDKIRDVSTLEGIPIDQVFIGSCTNGRLEDLAAAAEVLKGQKVADYVKLIVTPASRKIYKQAMDLGIMETLAEAGAIITHPGCGLCCGRTGGILSDGERVVATITATSLVVWALPRLRFSWLHQEQQLPVQWPAKLSLRNKQAIFLTARKLSL